MTPILAELSARIGLFQEEIKTLQKISTVESAPVGLKLIHKRKVFLENHTKLVTIAKKILAQEDSKQDILDFKKQYYKTFGNPSLIIASNFIDKARVVHELTILKNTNFTLHEKLEPQLRPYIAKAERKIIRDYPRKDYLNLWNILEPEIKKYLAGINICEKNKPTQVVQIIKNVLENINQIHNSQTKWNIRIHERPTFAIKQAKKIILVPNRSQSQNKIKGILAHEILVHLLRGELSNSSKLLNPLPKYRIFEEGLGKTLQKLSLNTEKIPIYAKHQPHILGLSHAGLSLNEIFELIIFENKQTQKKHLDRAKRRTIKSRYGLSINMPLYPKDLAYGIGSELIHELCIANTQNQDTNLQAAITIIFRILLEAKFDATNLDHIDYLIEKELLYLTKDQYNVYKTYIGKSKIKEIKELIPILG